LSLCSARDFIEVEEVAYGWADTTELATLGRFDKAE